MAQDDHIIIHINHGQTVAAANVPSGNPHFVSSPQRLSASLYSDADTFRVPVIEITSGHVTADTILWTADTHCVTADGYVICFEQILSPSLYSDSDVFRVPAITAESGVQTLSAALYDEADAFYTPALTTSSAALATSLHDDTDLVHAPTIELTPAVEQTVSPVVFDDTDTVSAPTIGLAVDQTLSVDLYNDADTFPVPAVGDEAELPGVIGGGGVGIDRPWRPFPVEGYGFGILPQLEGEAHGVVGAVAKGAAQFLVHATAIGACGQAGNAAVVLKGLSVAGKGAVGIRGAGEGVIVKFSGTATGRHDDDEAAVIAFLLAA